MSKIDLNTLSKKTLVDLLKLYSTNTISIADLWFINVEEKLGLDKAIEIDKRVWERYGATEARRLIKALNITEKGISALVKALNFQIFFPGMEYEFSEVTEKKAVFSFIDYTAQGIRIRQNKPKSQCKSVGEALFPSFAKTIDQRLEVRCLESPSNIKSDDKGCCWEFQLKGDANEKIDGQGKIEYLDLSADTLVELIRLYSKNVTTIDGIWFISLEEMFDLETAIDLDIKVWRSYGTIEAKRIMTMLNISSKGMPALIEALNYQIWVPGMDYEFAEVKDDRIVFNITDCTPQKARKRDNRGEFPCKPVGIALFDTFAEAIDPKLKMKCLICPPDAHPEDVWCSWEFQKED